jgi:DNA invertase Pin-like site-specific DNA recombinase
MPACHGYGRHLTSATEREQREAVEKYYVATLKPKGYKWGGWYYDAAGSQPLTERPEGLRLWLALEQGDHVVAAQLDSAFRSLVDCATTIETMQARSVHLVALDLGLDSSTPEGEAVLRGFVAGARLQHRYAAERTRESLREKASRGVPIGRAAASSPYGWRRVGRGERSYLVRDDDERRRIEVLRGWRSEGLSLAGIARRALERQHRWLSGDRSWYPSSIAAALVAVDRGYPKRFVRSKATGPSWHLTPPNDGSVRHARSSAHF